MQKTTVYNLIFVDPEVRSGLQQNALQHCAAKHKAKISSQIPPPTVATCNLKSWTVRADFVSHNKMATLSSRFLVKYSGEG